MTKEKRGFVVEAHGTKSALLHQQLYLIHFLELTEKNIQRALKTRRTITMCLNLVDLTLYGAIFVIDVERMNVRHLLGELNTDHIGLDYFQTYFS